MGIISLASRMELHQLLDCLWSKESAIQCSFSKDRFAQERLEFSTKPMANGNAESHFPPIQVFRRQQFFQHSLQQIFRGEPAQLEFLRQACRKFNKVMIQKRRASLERNCHGGDVHFYQ